MIAQRSPDASRPRRRNDIMRCVDDLGDVVPFLLDVEVHPDPPPPTHVRRPEESPGIESDPVLLRTFRSGRPERHPVVMVPVGERDELLSDKPGRLAVADPLGHARQGDTQVPNPLHALLGARNRHPRNGTSAHPPLHRLRATPCSGYRTSPTTEAPTSPATSELFAVGELTWRGPVKRVRLEKRARRPGCRGANRTRLRCGVKEV
jgi:hypothetical protein